MIPASSTQPGWWEERVSATDWDSVRADLDTVPESGGRTYSLLGADRRLYRRAAPAGSAGTARAGSMVGSTARRRCAPSPAAATPLTGFSSLMSRPPSPPGTGPAPFACPAPMQHGKPDDHDDDPFPVGRGVTASPSATAAIPPRRVPPTRWPPPGPLARARSWPSSTGPPQPHPGCGPRNGWPAASPTYGSWLIPRPDAHSSPAVSPASPAGLPAGRSASPAWPLLTSWH